MSDIQVIKSQFQGEIELAKSGSEVESLRVKYLGKSGLVADQMKKIASLSVEEKKAFGATVNEIKNAITEVIDSKKKFFELQEVNAKLASEKIDVTLPARNYLPGKLSPLTQVTTDLKQIFASMGFECIDGPEVEDDWHNFTALNFQEDHPARQMHDTFYIKDNPHLVLRTHTSNLQVRYMKANKPPFKVITIGRTFRSDYDATHTPMFTQLEGFYVDKHVNIGHMKSCLETFLRLFFGVESLPIRLRPSFFPFTEPSAEVDVKCDRSNKEEIKFGVGNDWLEILGCGMIHPNVLKNVGIDPDEYQGFAFGAGVERLAMLKYNIPDLRTFFEMDVRWLKHYGF